MTASLPAPPPWWDELSGTLDASPSGCAETLEYLRSAARAGTLPPPPAAWMGLPLLSALFMSPSPDDHFSRLQPSARGTESARAAIARVLISAGHDPAQGLPAIQDCPDPSLCEHAGDGTGFNPAMACPLACAFSTGDHVLVRVLVTAARAAGHAVPSSLGFAQSDGDTWLHAAVRANRTEMAQALLELGWRPLHRNARGETAFHLANDVAMLKVLRQHARIAPGLAPSLIGHWLQHPSAEEMLSAMAGRPGFADAEAFRQAWAGATTDCVPASSICLPGAEGLPLTLRAVALLGALCANDRHSAQNRAAWPFANLPPDRTRSLRALWDASPPWTRLERALAQRVIRMAGPPRNGEPPLLAPDIATLAPGPEMSPGLLALVLLRCTEQAAAGHAQAPRGFTFYPEELSDVFAPGADAWSMFRAMVPQLGPGHPARRASALSSAVLAADITVFALATGLPPAATPADVDAVVRAMAVARLAPDFMEETQAACIAAAARWDAAAWAGAQDAAWDLRDGYAMLPVFYRDRGAQGRGHGFPDVLRLCASLRGVRTQCRHAAALAAPPAPARRRQRA